MCCCMGCTPEGVSQQGSRARPPAPLSGHISSTASHQEEALGEPDRGVGVWKGRVSDLCHPLCCGSPQSRATAHGPRVADVAPSLTRATPKTSCPHPPGVAPHPPADPPATSKVRTSGRLLEAKDPVSCCSPCMWPHPRLSSPPSLCPAQASWSQVSCTPHLCSTPTSGLFCCSCSAVSFPWPLLHSPPSP